MQLNEALVLEPAASMDETTASSAVTTITADERAQLMRICLRATRDRDTAEDLVQETLLEAWRHWHKLRDAGDLQARARWLAAIASHVCHRWARSHGRDLRRTIRLDTFDASDAVGASHNQPDRLVDMLASEDVIDAEIEHAERVELLERALGLLPRETRDVLVARYLAETSPHEIATRYGLSEATLSVRLHRGRQALRQLLATTLREDAIAYGLIAEADEAWQETRIWCPVCGRARLHGQLSGTPAHLRLYCMRCGDSYAGFIDHVSYQGILDGIKTFKAALNRVMVWAGPYYHQGATTGEVLCQRCGRQVPLLVNETSDTHPAVHLKHGVRADCSCNAINTSELAGMALFTPEGRGFWQAHPRIHMLPERYVEMGGRDAIVIGYKSVTGSASFDALYVRDTFELIATNETPGT